MKTISLLSQKGGAGKTTLAISSAGELARRGRLVVLLDFDPQASAAKWADRRTETAGPDVVVGASGRVGPALEKARSRGYDVAVIDTPPHSGMGARDVALLSDVLLVPCRLSILDMDAIEMTLQVARLAERSALVVLNDVPVSASRVLEDARHGVSQRGGACARSVIRSRAALRHCLSAGQTIQEWRGADAAASDVRALVDEVALEDARKAA